jgi:hypothetical protein
MKTVTPARREHVAQLSKSENGAVAECFHSRRPGPILPLVVRFCAPADNEVAATSIAANVCDLTKFNLPWGYAGTNTG